MKRLILLLLLTGCSYTRVISVTPHTEFDEVGYFELSIKINDPECGFDTKQSMWREAGRFNLESLNNFKLGLKVEPIPQPIRNYDFNEQLWDEDEPKICPGLKWVKIK